MKYRFRLPLSCKTLNYSSSSSCRGRAVQNTVVECRVWVQVPLETYIFNLNFRSLSGPNSTAEPMQMKSNMTIHLQLSLCQTQNTINHTRPCTYSRSIRCVPRAPVCEVQSRLYMFAYCLNPYKTMHFTRFSHPRNATYNLNRLNRLKCIVFCGFNQQADR